MVTDSAYKMWVKVACLVSRGKWTLSSFVFADLTGVSASLPLLLGDQALPIRVSERAANVEIRALLF